MNTNLECLPSPPRCAARRRDQAHRLSQPLVLVVRPRATVHHRHPLPQSPDRGGFAQDTLTLTKRLDWEASLYKYIKRKYSAEEAEQHREQFAQVATMRATTLGEETSSDRRATTTTTTTTTTVGSEAKMRALAEYFRLLCAMELRFDADELRMHFVWRDAYSHVVKQGESDIKFEAAVALFNYAAEVSLYAVRSHQLVAEGLRVACNLYQQAAGLLEHLSDYIKGCPWAARTTIDLSPQSLSMLKRLMLAQAQLCFYERASLDGMSPKLLSRIAAQLALAYDEVAHALNTTPLREVTPPVWAQVVGWNRRTYAALSQLHAAAIDADEFRYGKQVCRLALAHGLLKGVADESERRDERSRGANEMIRANYRDLFAKVASAYAQACKDNDVLYLEVVPAASTLEQIQPLVVSKPTPTTALTAPLLATEDPFVFIVPQATRALLIEYDGLERALVSALQEQLAQAVAHGEGVLRDNDLPWALQAVEADTGECSPRRPAFPTGEGLPRELLDSIGVHARAHHGAPPPLPTGEGLPRELRDSIGAAHANGGVPALRTEVADEH